MKPPRDQLSFDFNVDTANSRNSATIKLPPEGNFAAAKLENSPPSKSDRLSNVIAFPLTAQRGLVEGLAFAALKGQTAFDSDCAIYDGLSSERERLTALGIPPAKVEQQVARLHAAVNAMIITIMQPATSTSGGSRA